MYQCVLKNATIADGTGKALYCGDICIQEGKIAAILPSYQGSAEQILDVSGLITAPGFIDIHTHSDCVLFQKGANPESKLYQGVTLEMIGNCGISNLPAPKERQEELTKFYNAFIPATLDYTPLDDSSVADYAKHLNEARPAVHYGVLIGHGTLRGAVMGFDMRHPTPQEQEQMEQLLAKQLEEGAFGMSLGLIYPPSSFARAEELIGLGKVLAAHNAILAVHMRSESAGVFEAVEEMLHVAEASGVHLEISHLKLMGKAQWGKTERLLSMLDQARSRGVRVTCDQYPYHASSTGLSALAPGWAHDGGVACLTERAKHPTEMLLEAVAAEMDRRGGPEAVMIVDTNHRLPEIHGMTMDVIARQWQMEPAQAVLRCLALCDSTVACIYFSMSMEDVCQIMQDMNISVGSDGVGYEYAQVAGKGLHPRNFGTFPRFLQTVRERKLMPVEQAVYKMTGLPASVLGIKDRGIIREGMVADLTVFDPEKVEDRSTFMKSAVKPAGICHVIVAGQLALTNGEQTDARAGGILLHTP